MKEIIKELYEETGKLNKKAIVEARKNKGTINQLLLEELEKNIENLNKNEGFPLFVDYAIFLLAEFQEKKTFPLLLKIASLTTQAGYTLFNDGVMDKLTSIIISVFDGDFKSLNKIIETKEIDPEVRGSFLKAYIYFYHHNVVKKEKLIDYLKKLIHLYNYKQEEIYEFIIEVIINTELVQLIEEVKRIYEEEAIDYYMVGGYADFIDNLFGENKESFEKIKNVEESMRECYSFEQEGKEKQERQSASKDLKKQSIDYNKVGRNDPCPCGSGKKYKKCCLGNNENQLPYQNYINESQKNYPQKNNSSNLNFYSFYEEENIEIDKLIYKAVKPKEIPIFITRDLNKENDMDYNYLDKAYPKIKEVIAKYNMKTIEEYDLKVSIHFSLYLFFTKYTSLMINKIRRGRKDILSNLKEIIEYFYQTFQIDKEWENIFFDPIKEYCEFTKQYDEAINYFESKRENPYNTYDAYENLFYFYNLKYDYEEYIKIMDEKIEKEKSKELKDFLEELKLDYID